MCRFKPRQQVKGWNVENHIISSQDSEQSAKVILPPSGQTPQNAFVQTKPEDRPFVLNPGRWQLHLRAQKRLFLDYVVLVPSENARKMGIDFLKIFNKKNKKVVKIFQKSHKN